MASVRTSHSEMDQVSSSPSSMAVQPGTAIFDRNKIDYNGANYEKSLFSSSLSDIFARKMRLSPNEIMFHQPVATIQSRCEEDETLGSLEEIEAQTIGNLLPDDDDLLAGIVDELDCIGAPCNGDDTEEFDLFSSVGGLELEMDDMLNACGVNKTPDFLASLSNGQHGCTNSSFTGEHPCGEHPSRTLFVRNININIEDSELKTLFEDYGDIRTLYTACKPRGFVMISYYDLRAARNAMRALQNKALRGRNLDIHFSIPKDNPSEKDINQGTLVVFNLDTSVSNDELHQLFGVYGEIKEIRETPHKRHHKFIEFYDVRAAEAALRALNKSDIAGKRIKLEPSRPGGARRSLLPNFSVELEQEQSISTPQQGNPGNSLAYASVSIGALTSSGLDNGPVSGLHSSSRGSLGQLTDNGFLGHARSVPHSLPTLNRVSSIAGQSGVMDPSPPGHINFGFQSMTNFHPHSLPDYSDNLSNASLNFNSPSTIASGISALAAEAINNRRSTLINQNSFDGSEGALSSANGNGHLHGRQYLWGNTNSYHPHSIGTMMWPGSPSFVNGARAHSVHGLHGTPSHMINSSPQHHHHVGSAPANNPTWDHRRGFVGDVEASLFHPGSLGSMGFSGNTALHPLELASHSMFSHVGGNGLGHPPMSSPSIGIPSPQQRAQLFTGRSHIIPPMPNSFDGRTELRLRSRRSDANVNQIDNKKLYELDIDRIIRGEDSRTTLMIKNIPNKYTSKMLLAAIDERHRGTYDFIYLPIDFKNKCNVGYAFINMIDTMHIVPFYEALNGKKWEKFNSEKVASLAYARIQGKAALIAHFQNSSLMNEDKRCRPILFHSNGPNAGDQEPFPLGSNIRSRPGKSKITNSDDTHQGSPPLSLNIEEPANGIESLPGFSSKDAD